jgi:predicted dinucleotide-binding enzyme
MNIGVLGTGTVGRAIATALVARDHCVMMGSRTADNETAGIWAGACGADASQGTFNDAAAFGDLVFICLKGEYTLEALHTIDPANLGGKPIIDITNPIDFTQGIPPRMLDSVSGTSMGELIQQRFPGAHVVKTLNTVNYKLMVDARSVNKGDHHLFLCGNDIEAKHLVKHLLVDNFYWKPENLVDLGGIEHARAVEAMLPFWISVWRALGTPLFNFKIVQ